jgi:hypothetical protein
MVVYPEPLSTGAGITLVADGIRRITNEIGWKIKEDIMGFAALWILKKLSE